MTPRSGDSALARQPSVFLLDLSECDALARDYHNASGIPMWRASGFVQADWDRGGGMIMSSAGTYRRVFGPALLAGLAAVATFGPGSVEAAAGQLWPHAPFGTPPSFSRDDPHPLYVTGRFIPLQKLVDQEKAFEARRRSIPDTHAETFAALQRFVPRRDVAPSESTLAYGPAQMSPGLEEPHDPRSERAQTARVRHRKPARVRLAEHRDHHRQATLAPPLDIVPPVARGR